MPPEGQAHLDHLNHTNLFLMHDLLEILERMLQLHRQTNFCMLLGFSEMISRQTWMWVTISTQ